MCPDRRGGLCGDRRLAGSPGAAGRKPTAVVPPVSGMVALDTTPHAVQLTPVRVADRIATSMADIDTTCCAGNPECRCESGRLHRRALALSWFTVGYNIVEGVVSILAGAAAGSIALVGFGADSFVESLSGGIMIWRFSQHGRVSKEQEERIEHRATKLVGWSFFVLAAYVAFEAVKKLVLAEAPEPTALGIIVPAVSLVVMPALFLVKRHTARRVGSRGLAADSKQTLACSFLSFALLVGMLLNQFWGFWQADPVVALVIATFLVREGVETVRTAKLCSC